MYADSTNRVFFIEVNYFSFNGCCQEADILEIPADSNWMKREKATGLMARMISVFFNSFFSV